MCHQYIRERDILTCLGVWTRVCEGATQCDVHFFPFCSRVHFRVWFKTHHRWGEPPLKVWFHPQADRQTGRRTDHQINRQLDRQTDRQTIRSTDRQPHILNFATSPGNSTTHPTETILSRMVEAWELFKSSAAFLSDSPTSVWLTATMSRVRWNEEGWWWWWRPPLRTPPSCCELPACLLPPASSSHAHPLQIHVVNTAAAAAGASLHHTTDRQVDGWMDGYYRYTDRGRERGRGREREREGIAGWIDKQALPPDCALLSQGHNMSRPHVLSVLLKEVFTSRGLQGRVSDGQASPHSAVLRLIAFFSPVNLNSAHEGHSIPTYPDLQYISPSIPSGIKKGDLTKPLNRDAMTFILYSWMLYVLCKAKQQHVHIAYSIPARNCMETQSFSSQECGSPLLSRSYWRAAPVNLLWHDLSPPPQPLNVLLCHSHSATQWFFSPRQ